MRVMRTVTIGGIGLTTTIEDVVRVANGGRVEFEAGILDKIKKQVDKDHKTTEPSSRTDSKDHKSPLAIDLSQQAIRAGVFVRLVTLTRSRCGIRPEVLMQLQEKLNDASTEWKLSADAFDCAVLQKLLATEDHTHNDRTLLASGSCISAAVGALAVHHGRLLTTIGNAVASLSCEALGASTKTLDAQRQEATGNKNVQEVAEVLRTMLSGSKRVNSKKQGIGIVRGVADLPMIHGSVLDALPNLQTCLRPELNAQALDVKSLEEFPTATSLSLFVSLEGVTKSFLAMISSSFMRIRHLLDRLVELSLVQEIPNVTSLPKERLSKIQILFGNHCDVFESKFGELKGLLSSLCQMDGEAYPSAGMALVGYEMLRNMAQALSLECVLCSISLIVLEGPVAQPVESTPTERNPKKEKKRKSGGLMLGQGSAAIREFFKQHLYGEPSLTPSADPGTSALNWTSFLNSDEQLSSVLTKCLALFSLESTKIQEVAQTVQQQIEKHQAHRKPKIPKGARDFLPDQMRIRQKVFDKITAVFKRHGAVSIDTPVFELKETLTGKYGEDSKLIYDLADQGGEILSLRYDLTVPFARYVALNSVGNIKRYHIGKVYRRDQPQMTKGRYREFFQCDFDIAGSYSVMVPDAECVAVLVEILNDLQLGEFEVKVNHRRLIDAMMDICGVPAPKHRSICSAIDKLDKEPWEVVKAEMVIEKGLDEEIADKLGEFVQLRDTPRELLRKLTLEDHPFMQNAAASEALKEMEILIQYLDHMQALKNVVFDLSLARGLDYYSGLIYEAIFKDAATGSVAAGGRYDKLVGMFSGKDVPAVGVSIGVERVFAIMEKQMKEEAQSEGSTMRTNDTEVVVASIGNGLQQKRMEICSKLWAAGIAAEFGYKPNPKMGDNFDYALQEGIPFMVLFGEDELNTGVVKIKDLTARTEETVEQDRLLSVLQQRLSKGH